MRVTFVLMMLPSSAPIRDTLDEEVDAASVLAAPPSTHDTFYGQVGEAPMTP